MLILYHIYVDFACTPPPVYEHIKSDALWFLLDAAYLDSPSKRVIFPRVEVYCQIEVALGHEPPPPSLQHLPAQRGNPEDSSQTHVQGAPKEDRKDSHSPEAPSVQTPESGCKGFVESPVSPSVSSAKQQSAPPLAPAQPGPVMGPTCPSDSCPINVQTPNLEQGVKDDCHLNSATEDQSTNSFLPVLLPAADSHGSKAGSSVPVGSPESPGLPLRPSQGAIAARVTPGLLFLSHSPPPAQPPVEDLGPERPTGMTLPALARRQAINNAELRNTSSKDDIGHLSEQPPQGILPCVLVPMNLQAQPLPHHHEAGEMVQG